MRVIEGTGVTRPRIPTPNLRLATTPPSLVVAQLCLPPLPPLAPHTALAPSPPLDSGSGVNGSLIRGNSTAHRGSIMHTLSNDTWCTEGGGEDAVPPSCLHRGWNAFRAGVRKHIVEKKWFDNGVLLFILANCVTLAMDNPLDPPGTPKADFLAATELVGGVDVVLHTQWGW